MDNDNLNTQPSPTLPPDPAKDGPLNFISDSNQITGSAASLLGTSNPNPAPEASAPTEPTPAPNPLAPTDAAPAPAPETTHGTTPNATPETPAPDSPAPAADTSAASPAPSSNPAADALVAAANADPGFNMQSGAFGPGQPKKKLSPTLIALVAVLVLLVVGIAVYLLLLKK